MRRALLTDCVAAALLAALVLTSVGVAHDGGTYYVQRWKSTERDQNYGFASDVGANFKDRVENAAQEWNGLSGNMQFHRGGVNVTWSYGDSDCHAAGSNSIHIGSIDGATTASNPSTLATTTTCVYSSDSTKIWSFRTKFDSAENWYTGTGSPGSSQFDAQSVATHELGHATGFGRGSAPDHWDPSNSVCTDSPKHTMCPVTPSGTTFERSLEEHDRHTFNNVY